MKNFNPSSALFLQPFQFVGQPVHGLFFIENPFGKKLAFGMIFTKRTRVFLRGHFINENSGRLFLKDCALTEKIFNLIFSVTQSD